MYPYLLQSMAAERAKELREEAATGARVRRARGTRARPGFRHRGIPRGCPARSAGSALVIGTDRVCARPAEAAGRR